MPISDNLKRLIDTNAPLWAGEAEVVRTYWTSPVRTRETDKRWLKCQCWKEFAGIGDSKGVTKAVVSNLAFILNRDMPHIDVTVDRHDIKEELEKSYVEFTHYVLFADIHDMLCDKGEPRLNANILAPWPEEETLAARRREARKTLGKIGARASDFTEGGYCTMYSEGAKLKGRPGLDGHIGTACQKVYDDEFGHMMYGVVGVDDEGFSRAEWDQLTELTLEQLRLRIYMRNAQFTHPLPDSRIKEIIAGRIEPLSFDFAKAESYLASHAAAAQ